MGSGLGGVGKAVGWHQEDVWDPAVVSLRIPQRNPHFHHPEHGSMAVQKDSASAGPNQRGREAFTVLAVWHAAVQGTGSEGQHCLHQGCCGAAG